MISVIVPTNRIGGMDLLFGSLERQTFKDFEVIVVDGLRHWRGLFDYLAGRNNPGKGAVAHVAPRDNPFPRVSYCQSVNSGIANALGETCVLFCDYTFAAPDCLATHAACQAAHAGPTHLDYNYSALPALKDGLSFYGQRTPPDSPAYLAELNETTDRYVADLESGKLDPFMWSIFAEPQTQEMIDALEVTHRHRPCATREADDWNWCSLKNESFPTELLLEMNGLNEALDESHCYQDQEFSYRLRARGIKWTNGPIETGMCTIVNPREVLNVKRLSKPIEHNMRLATGTPAERVNPGWSLRDWRKATIR